ncbi:MAG: NfeD family protein [Deltaproteobacteria bacterium]|nr:NfeD family protein [Deltaproteobacteria bacterium]
MNFFGLQVEMWQIYTVIAVIMMISEIAVPGFVLFPIGVGILATAPLSIFVTNITAQMIIMALAITFSLVLFRKFIPLNNNKVQLKTNVDHMIGKTGIVQDDVNNDLDKGYVKLYGDSWRAVSADGKVIMKGSKVVIERLDGNKVIVRKKNSENKE